MTFDRFPPGLDWLAGVPCKLKLLAHRSWAWPFDLPHCVRQLLSVSAAEIRSHGLPTGEQFGQRGRAEGGGPGVESVAAGLVCG